MQFGPLPLKDAAGKILAHNMAGPDGKRLLHKGQSLALSDIEALREHGHSHVYVAWLDDDDVDENTAAQQTAQAICGDQIDLSRAAVGRVNLRALASGVLRVDTARLDAINQHDGITVATLPTGSIVRPRKIVATVKIIPYAVPIHDVKAATALAQGEKGVIRVDPLQPKTVGMILFGSPMIRERLTDDFGPLEDRIIGLGSQVTHTEFVELAGDQIEQRLAETIEEMRRAGVSLIMIAGETAIMHRNDMVPRAVERAGGTVACVGAPVEPGNLLMLAYLGDLPILGAPGCSRSPKANVVDQVIPRLLVGEHLTRSDIIALAHGGLLAR